MRYIRRHPGGIGIGFDSATANLISAQTARPLNCLIKGSHPEQEIDKVTTIKGCTIAGLNEMVARFSSSRISMVASDKIAKE
jgi:pyrroline-5-carboxylate reductase